MWKNSLGIHSPIPIILSLLGYLSMYIFSLLPFVIAGMSLRWIQRSVRRQKCGGKKKKKQTNEEKEIETVQQRQNQ